MATAVLMILLFPAVAAAEIRSATLQDATGDGSPDLAAAAVTYDTAGAIDARVTFTAAPPTGTNLLALVYVGYDSLDSCDGSQFLGAFVDAGQGLSTWQTVDGQTQADGTSRLEGNTLVMHAASAALADEPDCVFVRVNNGSTIVDRIEAVSFAGPGGGDPPPTPEPTPDPPDEPEEEDPVPPKPKATALERYDAAVAKCQKRKGKKARKACVKKAGKANKAGAKLAAKRRTNPFLGKAFIRTEFDPVGACGGSCLYGWIFSDDKYVYRGLPDDGPALARCKKVTAKGDKDGCLRYKLAKNHKSVKVGSVTLKLKGNKLTEASKPKEPYTRVAIPKAGGRYAAALSSISSFGIPGVNQSFFTSELQIDREGRFVTASAASGTNGQGSDFENSYTVVGADQKGHYAFEPGGTLALFFESGRITRRSALIMFGDKDKLGTVGGAGLFLNGSVYLPEDDD